MLYNIYMLTLVLTSVRGGTYDFDDSAGLGRRFDGIGGLSGGGATSKLLVNYPEPQKSQILDFLFKPTFGASLQILKVEIGGDVQSTDGTEASHMHYSWDENYQRGYEWWLMKEAKKRNPHIKLYGLPWGFPGWVAENTSNPYVNPVTTATYIIKWIQGAKTEHNLDIDYIGIWNERNYDAKYIKTLRKLLDSNHLEHVQIVASDGNWSIAERMREDKELAQAVQYIGAHYPGTLSDAAAVKTGKQLWASEDFNTINNNIGAGCLARTLNQNYVNGNMTSTIAWNLIASYYNNLPYYRNGLMTAVAPWSGHYVVEGPIWITAHTTQFTEMGWSYLQRDAGVGHFENGGSYVALVSPDKTDLTIVMETMSHDHSVCRRPPLKPYHVASQEVTIHLKGNFSSIKELNVWYSKPDFSAGNDDVYFEKRSSIKVTSGQATLNLRVDEIWTLTTITRGQKGSFPPPPPNKPFPVPYKDNFEGYQAAMEPYNLVPQLGSFEVFEESGNKFVRQTVTQQPVMWCSNQLEHNLNKSIAIIGDPSWVNISIKVDVRLRPVNGSRGILLAARIGQGGCDTYDSGGGFFYVFPDDGFYILSQDIDRKEVVSTGRIKCKPGWNTIELRAWSRYMFGYINGLMVLAPRGEQDYPASGFVGIGTDTWGLADFDNLVITTSPGP